MDRKAFVEKHIGLATKVAHSGEHHQHLMGAVLVKSGNVISVGHNSFKSHPLMGKIKTLHAEVDCLIGVRYKDISGSTMFVSRINRHGKLGMSKPCSICTDILKSYGVSKVYFTTALGVEEVRLS